jgi:aspartate racemase
VNSNTRHLTFIFYEYGYRSGLSGKRHLSDHLRKACLLGRFSGGMRMKKIGILGGLGPASTVSYYEYITGAYFQRYKDYAFPEILIYSVNFQSFIDLFYQDDWEGVTTAAINHIKTLHGAGADFALLATNTIHKVFDPIQEASPIPLISIVDVVTEAVQRERMDWVALLGTVFTMRDDFFVGCLARQGINIALPDQNDQEQIQEHIATELTVGTVTEEARNFFLRIISDFEKAGVQGVILACTEIPLLLSQDDCGLRLFDSTRLHAESALDYSLS